MKKRFGCLHTFLPAILLASFKKRNFARKVLEILRKVRNNKAKLLGDSNICSTNITYCIYSFFISPFVPWEYVSGVSRDFLGIPFSARGFRARAQKDIIVNFEAEFSIFSMNGMGRGYLLWKM